PSSLGAVQVGGEHEAALVVCLQQHGAGVRAALGVGRGHGHRIGIDHAAGARLLQQLPEGLQGLGVQRIGHGDSMRGRGRYCGPMSMPSHTAGFPPSLVQAVLASVAGRPGMGMRVLGISGLQGSGKSTLVAQVVQAAGEAGLAAASLSLDDFYLPRARRLQLAARVHPLLATRGPPGTHDLRLALDTIDALRAGGTPPLPRFDKLADDRLPEERWSRPVRPLDLLVFEGWCVGVPAEDAAALAGPVNPLEAGEDPDGTWRRYCNTALARDYPALWARLDQLWFLRPPDFGTVYEWRWQQEQ